MVIDLVENVGLAPGWSRESPFNSWYLLFLPLVEDPRPGTRSGTAVRLNLLLAP